MDEGQRVERADERRPHEPREAWLEALTWVMTRPPLIRDLPGGSAPLMHSEEPRLKSLVDQTLRAWPSLAATLKSHKLGLAFEALVLWGMTEGLGWTLLGRDVQVFEGKRTIGALDFIIRDERGQVTHWELAYKLYLQRDQGTGWGSWLGPAGRDRLSLKLEHMLSHQLPLSRRQEAKSALASLGVERIDHHRVMMQGTLFSPWNAPPVTPEGGTFPAEGRWLREAELPRFVAAHPKSRFVPRLKPLWFGPSHAASEALSGEALLGALPLTESLLFSRREGAHDQLTFIVPDSWGREGA